MQRSLTPNRSPTLGLLSGLIITLAAVVAYSWYITLQIAGLREAAPEAEIVHARSEEEAVRLVEDAEVLLGYFPPPVFTAGRRLRWRGADIGRWHR